MPITTPDFMIQTYNNDSEHFNNILEYLFVPVLEKMGYDIERPITEGSEIIQSKIINNLFSADMVLCDISILNPNVFFELGIRTALNKKVCMVKDDITKIIPFDTSIINVHTYTSSLPQWKAENEKKDLERHIKSTKSQSNENALWSVFGVKNDNVATQIDESSSKEIELLRLQNQNLKEKLQGKEENYATSASVFRAKAHKCTHCGYSFTIDDQISLIASAISPPLTVMYSSMLPNVPEQNVVRCPKCKNIDVL